MRRILYSSSVSLSHPSLLRDLYLFGCFHPHLAKGDAFQGHLSFWFIKIGFLVPGTAPGERGSALTLDQWTWVVVCFVLLTLTPVTFLSTQCKMSVNGQRGECWCVDPIHGKVIQGAPTIRGDPECHLFYTAHEQEDRGAHALRSQ